MLSSSLHARYVGYAPVAPGTFGSAAGLAAFVAVRATGSPAIELATIVTLFAVGVWSAGLAERYFGGVDPGPIVMDEVVGMLITLALLPVTVTGAIVGFLVFRVLDVIKPWPSGRFEKLPGGLGVMADDGMAAIYGNLVMRRLIWLTAGRVARVTPLTRAAIIAVGSELLTPLRIDTNSLFITEQLNALGIDVVMKGVAGDDREELAHLFRAALARADLVVFTGGLGPTDDDVTREVVAATLGRDARKRTLR